MVEDLWSTTHQEDDYTCIDHNGNGYPEHKEDEYECSRCGAELENFDG